MGIPVSRLLVPDTAPAAPPGFDVMLQPLLGGVPAELRLDGELRLVIFAPSGEANLWRDSAPALTVCSASDELAAAPPVPTPANPTARVPVRLVLRRAGICIATAPLSVGLRRYLPDGGARGSVIELIILDYRLHAGTLCQAGDFGSFVKFAWRRVDRAANEFRLPALPPRVAERFVAQVQSQLGADGPAGEL